MTEEIRNDALAAIKNQSKVSPNPRKQAYARKAQWALLIIGGLLIGYILWLPASAKTTQEEENNITTSNGTTLSDNLKLLQQMREKERLRLIASGQSVAMTPNGNHPPKLRTANPAKTGLTKEMRLRMNAPTTFDLDAQEANITSNANATQTKETANKPLAGADANSAFINSQSDITQVYAKKLPHPNLTVPAGELIPATLVTAINSDLAGMVKAITEQDIYSLSGNNLLIPKGATLIGQFNASVIEGQSRILIVWNRVHMDNGVIVTLNSPGTDTLGRSGQGADSINRHFTERFATAALLSAFGAYTATAGVDGQDRYNSTSQYRAGLANSFQQTAGQTLERTSNIAPTLSVNQGAKINVFVAHDLDFARVGKQQVSNAHTVRSPTWK